MPSPDDSNLLIASYSSPNGSHNFEIPLTSVAEANGSTGAKTDYLSNLRSKTSKLQDDINVFLTQKMEEDKAASATAGQKSKVDEDKEEEMYGEEDPEQDG
ncbi:Hypothetical protein D9617_30g011270 [Elsinoe fawcettii]|nr:Hypothetical protein D9617_30g011270 [Elsinoe fawcettii]